MHVRPMTDADQRPVGRMHVRSTRTLGTETYTERQVRAWSGTDGDPTYPVGERGQDLLVAVSDEHRAPEDERSPRDDEGDVAGFGHLNREEREVQAVYVSPDYAREGVGTRILDRLEALAREANLDELALLSSRNAVPFYEARGWTVVEERTHETSGDGVTVDLPVSEMQKRLEG